MSLNEHIESIVGKKIKGVIVKESNNPSSYNKTNVFLVFDDDSYFEFYGGHIENAKGLYMGNYDDVMNYLPDRKVKFKFGS